MAIGGVGPAVFWKSSGITTLLRTMNKIVFVAVFVIIGSNSHLRASGPIDINLDKDAYLVGEPVWVELMFLPEGAVSGADEFWHNWNINYKLESAEKFFGMAVWSDIEENGKDIVGPLPNEGVRMRESFSIDTKNYYPEMSASDAEKAQLRIVFDKPGRYVFLANYRISAPSTGSEGQVTIKSEYRSGLVSVEVLPPEGKDEEAWTLLTEFPASVYYASGGLVSDPQLEDRAKETVAKLFSAYPDTIYAERYSRFLKENSPERWKEVNSLTSKGNRDTDSEVVEADLTGEGNEAKAAETADGGGGRKARSLFQGKVRPKMDTCNSRTDCFRLGGFLVG